MVPAIIPKLIPMLGSSYGPEVMATRDAIVRALATVGLNLNDLAAAIGSSSSPPGRPAPLPTFGDMARACRDLDRGTLSSRERSFVLQMCALGFGGRPSPRQADWLATIFARVAQREAA